MPLCIFKCSFPLFPPNHSPSFFPAPLIFVPCYATATNWSLSRSHSWTYCSRGQFNRITVSVLRSKTPRPKKKKRSKSLSPHPAANREEEAERGSVRPSSSSLPSLSLSFSLPSFFLRLFSSRWRESNVEERKKEREREKNFFLFSSSDLPTLSTITIVKIFFFDNLVVKREEEQNLKVFFLYHPPSFRLPTHSEFLRRGELGPLTNWKRKIKKSSHVWEVRERGWELDSMQGSSSPHPPPPFLANLWLNARKMSTRHKKRTDGWRQKKKSSIDLLSWKERGVVEGGCPKDWKKADSKR